MFDTNVVISAVVFGRHLGWLRAAWSERTIVPVVCAQTLAELVQVLAYRKLGLAPERQRELAAQYVHCADMVGSPEPWPALPVQCRDPKDEVFLALALRSGSPLVSGDADLTSLATQVSIPILSVSGLHDRLLRKAGMF